MHRPSSIALLAAIAVAFAACAPAPGATAAPTTRASERPVATTAATAEATAANLPTQSETGWGRIWDALPPSYPVPAGAEAAESSEGPVSAAYTVAVVASTPPEIAKFYLDALDAVGYGTGLDGPLEDGSFTVWSSSGFGCDSLVTVLPRGDESLITVLYGAGCAFA